MKAVHRGQRGKLKRIREQIENKELGSFVNMPRNVLYWQNTVDPVELINRNYHDFSLNLFTYLAERYPEYTFYLEANHSEGNKVYMTQALVLAGEEGLGRVEWSYYSDQMEFYNERVTEDIRRGSCKKTSKLATAKNIFARYFYPLTLQEEMDGVESDVVSALSDHTYSLKRTRDNATRDIIDKLSVMLKQESSELFEFVNAHGMSKQLEARAKDKEAIEITKRLGDAVDDGKGQFILNKGDMYYSLNKGVKRIKRDDLPEDVRTAVGLLKVAEDNTAIDGVGYKATADKFFIMEELNFDFDE
tara:strand:- start:5091 stop:5999 length:909 start_codon:yes stop_codon:yes gene_type:complete